MLTVYGFQKRIFGQSLRKPFEGGYAVVHLTFINHEDDFDITVDVGIRFDQLENLIHENNNLITEKEKAQTCTIGVEIGNLTIGEQKRWTVKDENDIEFVSQDIFRSIKGVVIPYINKYSNIENVFHLCLKDDQEASLNAPIAYVRAMHAVGLAKLLNKTELLEDVIQQKMKYLQEKKRLWFAYIYGFCRTYKKSLN